MNETKLKASLKALRAEVASIEASHLPSKARLEALVADIESASQKGVSTSGLVPKVREAVLHFEAEHPKVTALLNDVLVSLGNVGM